MQLAIAINPDDGLNLQTQIFEQIRGMILSARLRPGQRLPSSRLLAQQLGVSRLTITLAFARLADEGYIETARSIGTFVSSQIPEDALHAVQTGSQRAHRSQDAVIPHAEELYSVRSHNLVGKPGVAKIDFWIGRPDFRFFPLKHWAQLINRRLLSAGSALTEYRDPSGLLELRQAISDHLRPARGIVAEPEQIIITAGCQEALNLVCRMLIRPGTPAIVEAPGYAGASYLFESFGSTLHPVPVDEKGLDIAKLPLVSRAIAYVTPSHQYPLGGTLSLDRRLELLAWAVTTNSYIIEDDYDSDFRYVGSPLAALKALDQANRVFYVGTFSKCLGAGLRIGYVVLPPELVLPARKYKALANNGQPWLEQAALADFMHSGAYVRHLRKIRQRYLRKRNVLLSELTRAFGAGHSVGADAGMHLAWRLPEDLPAPEIIERSLAAGVGVYGLSAKAAVSFSSRSDFERFLLFGYSSLTEKQIEIAVGRIAECVSQLRRNKVCVTSGA